MLERTDATTNEVLEPVTFVLAYPTVCFFVFWKMLLLQIFQMKIIDCSVTGTFVPCSWIFISGFFTGTILVLFCLYVWQEVCSYWEGCA